MGRENLNLGFGRVGQLMLLTYNTFNASKKKKLTILLATIKGIIQPMGDILHSIKV